MHTPHLSLRKAIIRGSTWILGGDFIAQVIRLGGNLIMTRLLVPEMFGVMAVANVLILGLQLCSYMGIHHSIIQSPRGDEPAFLNTAWTFQIIRGCVLFLLTLLIAAGLFLANAFDLIAGTSAYQNPSLPSVLVALSFLALISGFESTKMITALRSVKFGHTTIVALISQVASLAGMILWAIIDRSIWALVAGTLLGAFTRTILSHWYMKGPSNKLMWDWAIFKELFTFGKWILLTTILGYLVSNGDRLIFAGLLSADILGVYTIALFITGAMQEIISKLVTNVTLPVLSQVVRERREDLSGVYYRIRFPIDLAVLFICGLLFISGHHIIDILYDHRYASAGPMLEILAVSLFGIRYIVSSQVYLALGKPKLLTPVLIVQLLVVFFVITPAFSAYGLEGAIWVIALTPLLVLPVTIYFMIKYEFFNLKKELYVLPALPAGMAVGALINIGFQYFN